ncbi:hypothetical protein L1049_002040 [Liquidambar formosana]|uniref:RING-type E3 ubiquitin transferase BRCA1 n=1 Tax=Liquidambar formosana TaxID=63359 RepID=A0AAP0R6C2_LIQFO
MEDDQEFAFRRCHSEGSRDRAMLGMESVIATVSGYHGAERFNLIKLISHTGANYVGAMTRSTTHLVCWKFEGRKYDLARKFKTLIVNHRWVEDCIKAGKRLPEDPYILQSGQEVGPLLLEVPLIANKVSVLTKKNRKVLSNQSNVCNDSKEPVIDFECGGTCHAVWTDSCLLNENLFPDSSLRSKKKTVRKTLKQDHRASSRYCFQEPPLSELVVMEHGESSCHYPMRSVRQKRDICDASRSTTSAEPSHKGRRLVKKNVNRHNLECVLLDSEQESSPTRTHVRHNNIIAPSNYPDGVRNENILINKETSPDGRFSELEGNKNDGFENVEEIKDLQDGCSDVEESLHGEMKDGDQIEHITRLPTSTELSCVICWTDFSSTRGVLPCGHRFCYSCIQNWADHMASRRKISTCPLCKASFVSITKVDDAATSDQKIYSQTIPCARSTTDIFILPDRETPSFGAQSSLAQVCCVCHCREPEDLLISCHLCQIHRIHSYCLDPPLLPWTCIHCKDLRTLYHLYH